MDSQQAPHFVTLPGSLRRGSDHADVARALPSLAPEGVTVSAFGSAEELPHYYADLQAEAFPPGGVGDGRDDSRRAW